MSFTKVFRVSHKQGTPYSVLLESRELNEGILLESGTVVSLSTGEREEIKADYTKAIDSYGCLGVIKFSDDDTTHSLYLVLVTACMPVGKVLNCEIFRITGAAFFSLQNGSIDSDSRCSDLKKLLCSGKFYFVWSSTVKSASEILDLTVSLQNQGKNDEEQRFFWNRLLHLHFKHFGADCNKWLFRVMCGGIDIRTVYVGAQQAKAMVISRLSCERAGTRFNVRGANDEGNVANFVESEQVIAIGNNISSYMQVRGSIPLFWEQPGLNVGSHKVRISRGFEATAPTYDRHFFSIVEHYGQCLIINLLGSKEGENMLSKLFQGHHENSEFKDTMPMHCFDYHVECRGGKSENLSRLKAKIWDKLEEFGCYTYRSDENLRLTQSGVARINCLDCLDRTNSVKTYFGLQMLSKQLESLGFGGNKQLEDRFYEAFKAAWPVTGDLISRMYAGTGALEGKTKLKDGARSVTRAIQNNFLDQNKQNAIDLMIVGTKSTDVELASRASNLLSGDCLQAPTAVLKGMCENYKDYTSDMPVRVAIGTWNVNGGKHFRSIAYKNQTLDDWLLNFDKSKSATYGKEKYKALFDFQGSQEGDLSFISGDVITVNEIVEGAEWMTGTCNGMSGVFPASFVKKVLPRYMALFDFTGQEDSDLNFVSGDIIEVTEMVGEWWKGKVERTEYSPDEPEGIFPASYVEIYKDSPQNGGQDSSEFENFVSDVDWNKAIDIYGIGFQEMVELSAGNIVSTSTTNQKEWLTQLKKTISSKYEYVHVASEQLVGVCLYVFVRPQHAPHIRDVEIVTVKTGMGGATGNKGGIAIRMQFYNSSLCFICTHLAAGQSQVQDRNNDFAEISKKIVFNGNKSIYCHDYVFWCGDLNYRIDMPIDEVKNLVATQDWTTLQTKDQLAVEKSEGKVFQAFTEGETNFAPTYKYDPFSDDYDTSEKSRIPAWTDRVLWYRRKWFSETQGSGCLVTITEDPNWNSGKLLYYDRAEIKTSDHRPVIAVLDINVLQSDEEHLDATFHKIVSRQGPPDASILVSLTPDEGAVDEPMSSELFEAILEQLESFGDVILTRNFKGKLLVIFKEGTSAVKSLTMNGTSVIGTPIFVVTKTGGWEEEVEHELRLRGHSTCINDSYAERYAKLEQVHYDYPPEEEIYEANECMTSQNHANYGGYNETEYKYQADEYADKQNDYAEAYSYEYSSEARGNQSTEEVLEDVNDPGWACEDSYFTAPPPKQVIKKASAPPRPPSAPTKKRAPPRPNTLPDIPAGPPPTPSQSPAMGPGLSGTKTTPPSRPPAVSPPIPQSAISTILVPEPALPKKIPKATPRSSIPKRRAPAPPPGMLRTRSVKEMPQSPAPALPLTAPKGPSGSRREHMNAAYIPENHSCPSLLDLDPFAPSPKPKLPAVRRQSAAIDAMLEPLKPPPAIPPANKQRPSDPFAPSSKLKPSAIQRPNSTVDAILNPLKPPPVVPSTNKQGTWASFNQAPPPPIAARRSTSKSSHPLDTSSVLIPSQPLRPTPATSNTDDWLSLSVLLPTTSNHDPFSANPPSVAPPTRPSAPKFRPSNPNYKPMVPAKPPTFAPPGYMGMGSQPSKPLTFVPPGYMGSQPLQPQQAGPLKPTVFPNGTAPTLSHSDPFGFVMTQDPTLQKVPPANDPWGTIGGLDKNSNIPNSFSTDFSRINFK